MQSTFGCLEEIRRCATNQMMQPACRGDREATMLSASRVQPGAACISHKQPIKAANALHLVLRRRTRHGLRPLLPTHLLFIYIFFIPTKQLNTNSTQLVNERQQTEEESTLNT